VDGLGRFAFGESGALAELDRRVDGKARNSAPPNRLRLGQIHPVTLVLDKELRTLDVAPGQLDAPACREVSQIYLDDFPAGLPEVVDDEAGVLVVGMGDDEDHRTAPYCDPPCSWANAATACSYASASASACCWASVCAAASSWTADIASFKGSLA